MGGPRTAMGGGALWYLFRSAVVALLTLRIVTDDALFHLSLMWVGGPGLLLVVLFAGAALLPEARRFYVAPLRIGVLLAAITDLLVAVSGSYIPAAQRLMPATDHVSLLVPIIVYGTLAVDLLIFAGLISYRPVEDE